MQLNQWTGTLVSLVLAGALVACANSGRGDNNTPGDGSTSQNDGGVVGDGGVPNDGGDGDAAACAVASDEPASMPVDIIIAIDQSASMGEERDGVRDNINDHLANILAGSNLDYRVILIHGGFCMDPPLGNPADCNADNPPHYYTSLHPVNSSDALTIFLWAFEGMHRTPNTCDSNYNADVEYASKLREESLKVFIVVTDDDPYSFSAAALGCSDCAMHQCPTFADSPADWGGSDFATELYNLPGNYFGDATKPRWIMHAIIGVDQLYQPADPVTALGNVCAFSGNTAETSGVEYQKLARLTGGLRFPSCDTDYSPVFNEIATTIIPLACEFLVESTNLGQIDTDLTNVEYDPMDGTGAITIPMDDTAGCDTGANGWQWSADFSRIYLCGSWCDAVQSNPNGRVSIVVGCTTVKN